MVLLHEDVLRAHCMHAYVAIDELSDVYIDSDACQHVGLIAVKMLLCHQEVDHVFHCHGSGCIQIWAKAHADIVRWGFRTGP